MHLPGVSPSRIDFIKKKNKEGKELKDDCAIFLLLCHGGLFYYIINFFFFLRNINRISIFYMRPEGFVFSSNAARVIQKVGYP